MLRPKKIIDYNAKISAVYPSSLQKSHRLQKTVHQLFLFPNLTVALLCDVSQHLMNDLQISNLNYQAKQNSAVAPQFFPFGVFYNSVRNTSPGILFYKYLDTVTLNGS